MSSKMLTELNCKHGNQLSDKLTHFHREFNYILFKLSLYET